MGSDVNTWFEIQTLVVDMMNAVASHPKLLPDICYLCCTQGVRFLHISGKHGSHANLRLAHFHANQSAASATCDSFLYRKCSLINSDWLGPGDTSALIGESSSLKLS